KDKSRSLVGQRQASLGMTTGQRRPPARQRTSGRLQAAATKATLAGRTHNRYERTRSGYKAAKAEAVPRHHPGPISGLRWSPSDSRNRRRKQRATKHGESTKRKSPHPQKTRVGHPEK